MRTERGTAMAHEHFHPLGKQPSAATAALRSAAKAALPFDDERDFDEARRGFESARSFKSF